MPAEHQDLMKKMALFVLDQLQAEFRISAHEVYSFQKIACFNKIQFSANIFTVPAASIGILIGSLRK